MIRSIVAGVSAAAVLLAAAPASAAAAPSVLEAGHAIAAPSAPAAARRTELTVSYLADAGYAAAVVLRCDPAGGAHPKKVKACRTLSRIHGDPARLRPAASLCTMEYAPITARIKGTWHGRRVNWSRTFGNTCDMTRTTGVLTAF